MMPVTNQRVIQQEPTIFYGRFLLLVCTIMLFSSTSFSADIDLPDRQDRYLGSIFGETLPASKTLWIKGDLRLKVAKILRHEPAFLRARYWSDGKVYVWVLDEIGKTQPITCAVTIVENRVEGFEVLAFRESRGWEVKHGFYTDQFIGAGAMEETKLDRRIDGITGATLSVTATKKMALLALLFTRNVQPDAAHE